MIRWNMLQNVFLLTLLRVDHMHQDENRSLKMAFRNNYKNK